MSVRDWFDDPAIAAEAEALQDEVRRLNRIRDAAPELLEALESMVAWANSSGAGGGYPGSQVAAAIAKARGEA